MGKLAFMLCAALLVAQAESAPGKFVSVRGSQIVAPDGTPLLLRGINLGNWLVPEGYMFKFKDATSPRKITEVVTELIGPEDSQLFWKEFQESYVTRQDIRFIKRLGFNSVRVPFNYRLFLADGCPDAWSGPGFALLDSVVRWCRESDLWVILDMHCAPGGQTGDNIDDSWGYPWLFESPRSRAQTVELWRRIAARFSGEPAVLGYDLLNEPIATYEGFPRLNQLLEPLYKEIVQAVRTVDTNHVVILGGAQWDTNFDVFGPPFDRKAVYTFHRYWFEVKQEAIQSHLDFREKYGVPIWMGESGENSDAWIESYRLLLERNNIGWCFWPYKKMDASSCLMTFPVPEGYDRVRGYADSSRSSYEAMRRLRPPAAEVRTVLKRFIANCRFENCRLNEGYARALGVGEK